MPVPINRDNRDFWRKAYIYITHWKMLAEVGFCVHNRGDTTIDDVTVEIAFATDDNFLIVARVDMPKKPAPTTSFLYPHLPSLSTYESDIRVEKRGTQTVVTLSFGKLQAGQRRFLPDALYLGNPQEKHIVVDAVVRADQFPSPLTTRLEFHSHGTVKKVDWNELKKAIEDHFFGAEEDAVEDSTSDED
jgi:hypothetical protein